MKEMMTMMMRKTMSRWDDLQLNERETCVCVCVSMCACMCVPEVRKLIGLGAGLNVRQQYRED